jgi:cytidylate kinase
MIITIDGPAGSGKSTAARKLAARLQIPYLDTGAMYRALAYAALLRGIDLDDRDALLQLARSVSLEVDCGPTHTRVRVDGQDVTEAIRTLAVSTATPAIARHPGIRALLVERQREIGRSLGSLVSEGRDQGAVVFPDADVKFVLEASPAKRAERRFQEMLADGDNVSFPEVLNNIVARDATDLKQWEPLLSQSGVVVIDTTAMSIAEVINRLAESAASFACKKGAGGCAGASLR